MKAHNHFDITYMAWEEFRDLLLERKDFVERLTSDYSLLIGGSVYDHTYVYLLLRYDILLMYLGSDKKYGLEDKKPFFQAFTELSHWLFVWPPVPEMIRECYRHEFTLQLDRIAHILNTPRPTTIIYSGLRDIPTKGTWVFKRDFSRESSHVKVIKLDGFTMTSLGRFPDLNEVLDDAYDWIIQSYAPLLPQWGEWRVFMVGGKAKSTVLTTWNSELKAWTWNKVETLFTLEELTLRISFSFAILD